MALNALGKLDTSPRTLKENYEFPRERVSDGTGEMYKNVKAMVLQGVEELARQININAKASNDTFLALDSRLQMLEADRKTGNELANA